MKIPMTEDRLYVAARVLCELRGDTHEVDGKPSAIFEFYKSEIGKFVQVLTAVEHSYELLPLTDAEKIATK